MTGARYVFRPLDEVPSLAIVAIGPADWIGYPSWALDGPDPVRANAPTGIGIAFPSADGIYSDPCHWDVLGNGKEGQPGDVAVGPTVDDLVAALRANTFYTSTVAKRVTVHSYEGKELELQLPARPFTTCDKTAGARVLAIAISGDDDSFETLLGCATPVVESIEFHTP